MALDADRQIGSPILIRFSLERVADNSAGGPPGSKLFIVNKCGPAPVVTILDPRRVVA